MLLCCGSCVVLLIVLNIGLIATWIELVVVELCDDVSTDRMLHMDLHPLRQHSTVHTGQHSH